VPDLQIGAPDPLKELNPANLKAGLLAAVSGAAQGSAEAELAANLAMTVDQLEAKATAYLDACAKRKNTVQMASDVLTVASAQRDRFRQLGIFEHRELFPENDLKPARGTRFDATTCALTQ
jgi:hypothetical protein